MTRSLFLILFGVCGMQCALADDATAPPGTAAPAQPPLQAPSQAAIAAARAACDSDIQKFCPSVQPGGGRIMACLKEHKDEVSDGCKQAVVKVIKKGT